jgi:hypothetical protein
MLGVLLCSLYVCGSGASFLCEHTSPIQSLQIISHTKWKVKTEDLSSSHLRFSLAGDLGRSTKPGAQMSGIGRKEVNFKYPVESSRVHLQYTEYGVGSVYNKKFKHIF